MSSIKTAVVPAAGWGTRFLPASKAVPKEMFPLVNKPMIQYAVEEAVASGIEEMVLVTSRGKSALEDHFDRAFELERTLAEAGKTVELEAVRQVSELVRLSYVRQPEQRGLGHAVLMARSSVGGQAFAVLLPDDLFFADPPVLAQLIAVQQRYGGSVLAVEEVSAEDTSRYGVIDATPLEEGVFEVRDLVEKPGPERAPSRLGIIGRYVLDAEVFACLERTTPGALGEIQLTDGIRGLLARGKVFAVRYRGERLDGGTPGAFLEATVRMGLRHPQLGTPFRDFLQRILAE